MADKSEDIQSIDDKVALAKELYGTGSRSYLVKSYSDAVEDLSKACEMFEAVHGHLADELGMPYLMYAKSLISVAQQGENKIVDVPDEEDDEQKNADGNGDDEEEEDDEDDEEATKETDKKDETENETGGKSITNGNGTNGTTSDPQPGTSSLATVDENAEDDDADSDTPAANLQLAWEVLELAVKIFTRQGEPALSNLAEAYFELAEISFENSHFETAVMDYSKTQKKLFSCDSVDLMFCCFLLFQKTRKTSA